MIVPFAPEHLKRIKPQEAQAHELEEVVRHSVVALSEVDGDRVFASGGVVLIDQFRALVWGSIGADAGSHMVAITRAAKHMLDSIPVNRLEMTVLVSFEAGHRWAKMLGFECEAPILKKFAHGRDYSLYAKVR
jgi:hypothetical protein